jgi:RNA recognition motif-containing protein
LNTPDSKLFSKGEEIMNIYVGNLNWATTEAELKEAFDAYGEVTSVNIIMDRNTGQSRGFGFIEMGSNSEGQAAVEAMNGADLGERSLKVNVARPRESGGRRSNQRDQDRW